MELRFRDGGDYIPGGNGGFDTVSGVEEVLQRALFKMTARRGKFPLLPRLGSRLYTLAQETRKNRQSAAEQYIAEALEDESELEIKNVLLSESGDKLDITVMLGYYGDVYPLSIEV